MMKRIIAAAFASFIAISAAVSSLCALAKSEEEYQIITLGELLPLGFGPKNIQ